MKSHRPERVATVVRAVVSDAIANKLIEKDEVVGVVSGSYSGPTRVTAPIFAKAGVPMVAGYAVHPDVTKAGDSNFRNGYLGEVEGGAAGEYAVKVLKSKSGRSKRPRKAT